MEASLKGKDKVISLLLLQQQQQQQNGGGVNQKKLKTGFTALHFACQNGHVKAVRELVRSNAEIEARTKRGSSSLFIACRNNHLEIVQFLLSAERNVPADIEARTKMGFTPLLICLLYTSPSPRD